MVAPASKGSLLTFPSGQRSPFGSSLLLWKEKKSHLVPKFVSTISTWSFLSLSLLTVSLLSSEKSRIYSLPCLVDIFTMGFLYSMYHCPKMLLYSRTRPTSKNHLYACIYQVSGISDIPVSCRVNLWAPKPGLMNKSTSLLYSMDEKCSTQRLWVRVLLTS